MYHLWASSSQHVWFLLDALHSAQSTGLLDIFIRCHTIVVLLPFSRRNTFVLRAKSRVEKGGMSSGRVSTEDDSVDSDNLYTFAWDSIGTAPPVQQHACAYSGAPIAKQSNYTT